MNTKTHLREFFQRTILVLLMVSPLAAQRGRITTGDLWETYNGLESPLGLQGMYMVWPAGGEQGGSLYEGGFRTNSTGAIARFMFKDYEYNIVDTNDIVVETDTIAFLHPSYALRTKTEAYVPQIFHYMRTLRAPTKVIDENQVVHENLVEKESQWLSVATRIQADERVEFEEYFHDGFWITNKYYAWANQFHDDYIIRVIEIVNRGNTDNDITTLEMDQPKDLQNLYVDLYVNNLSPNNKGEGYYSYDATGTWDNWHDYYGDRAGDTLRFMYAFDGDDPNIPGDDRGDPYPVQFIDDQSFNENNMYHPGEFISSMYAGYGVLHVETSANDRRDDPTQPFNFGYGDFYSAPSWREELRWGNVYNGGEAAILHPDYSGDVPKGQEACWMSFGPFDLPAWGDIKIVLVHAVNGPSVEANREYGRKYLAGEITKAEKDAFLDSGLDSLAQTIARAQWNWDNYLSKNRMLPNAPKPPSNLVIESAIRSVRLNWDPSDSDNLDGYRIYRKAGNNLGKFEFLEQIPNTATAYIDSSVDLGVSYYYYVTSVTDGSENVDPTAYGLPLESSKFFNRSYHGATAYRSAVSGLERVRVVPNPYNLYQTSFWPGEGDRLTFTNLTSRCTIRIFTVNGDLVKTLRKDNESAFLRWSPMLTDDNLLIAPDIYVFHVEDLTTGETTYGKFVVVR